MYVCMYIYVCMYVGMCMYVCLCICVRIIPNTIMVRTFTHGAMGRRIDPSCGEPIELFLVPASAPRLV